MKNLPPEIIRDISIGDAKLAMYIIKASPLFVIGYLIGRYF